jgi:hypothetical protein
LAQFHGTSSGVFFSLGPFIVFTIFFRLSNFLDLSITDDTLIVEMRIWCIKIGIVIVISLEYIVIKHALPLDVNVELKVRQIKYKIPMVDYFYLVPLKILSCLPNPTIHSLDMNYCHIIICMQASKQAGE